MLFALAQFDARAGNQVLWTSEPVEHADLPGLEFKMIPSGLHERRRDTVHFVCGRYFGVACFEASVLGAPGSREDVRMYSLAALSTHVLPWSQESHLRACLQRFVAAPSDLAVLPQRRSQQPLFQNHPMHASVRFVKAYGATAFELWKCGLARTRVLLQRLPGRTVKEMCEFAYVAQQLAAIPEDVADLLPRSFPDAGRPPLLGNVTLGDLQRLQQSECFWATTTDLLLLAPERDACDAVAEQHCVLNCATGPPGRRVWPTWRDRHRHRLLEQRLGAGGESASETTHLRTAFVETFVDAVAGGLMWWASAGESALIEGEEAAPLTESPAGLSLLGMFQQYTRQLVRVLARLADDSDGGLIRVGMADIAAMGLDPFSHTDREFLDRFAIKWWDRGIVAVGYGCC